MAKITQIFDRNISEEDIRKMHGNPCAIVSKPHSLGDGLVKAYISDEGGNLVEVPKRLIS